MSTMQSNLATYFSIIYMKVYLNSIWSESLNLPNLFVPTYYFHSYLTINHISSSETGMWLVFYSHYYFFKKCHNTHLHCSQQ